jgi:hypothetical protein
MLMAYVITGLLSIVVFVIVNKVLPLCHLQLSALSFLLLFSMSQYIHIWILCGCFQQSNVVYESGALIKTI